MTNKTCVAQAPRLSFSPPSSAMITRHQQLLPDPQLVPALGAAKLYCDSKRPKQHSRVCNALPHSSLLLFVCRPQCAAVATGSCLGNSTSYPEPGIFRCPRRCSEQRGGWPGHYNCAPEAALVQRIYDHLQPRGATSSLLDVQLAAFQLNNSSRSCCWRSDEPHAPARDSTATSSS